MIFHRCGSILAQSYKGVGGREAGREGRVGVGREGRVGVGREVAKAAR